MNDTVLRLDAISKRFGNLQVLDGVSFSAKRGERCGIIGPNGAGKSTLFNVVAGEIPATSGRVELFERDVTRLGPHRRARMGMARTFQTTTLFKKLTVLDNLVLGLQAHSPDRLQPLLPRSRYRDRIDEAHALLDRVGLRSRANEPITALGHGEQRQIEILLALAQKPRVLLLDEPTAGLSPGDATLVTAMLKADKSDVAMILIEHDMGVVFDVVDRLIVMFYGRVIADGSLEEVRANPEVQDIYFGGAV